jgi:NAD(P)-dependent dehydrogenase (short-subunit alcohol dehydrogenase family)
VGILDGKRAIITGAGQGVGQGIAFAFAAEGASVVVAGRTEAKLIDTATEIERRGGKALPIVCDVAKVEAIEACIERTVGDLGGIDILVNNAVVSPLGNLLEVTDKAFDLGFRVGPLAALRFMQRCHPHLKGDGVIINLGSGSALRADPLGLGAYAAVKESIRVLTRAAAVEWGPDGIRANVLMPLAMSPGMVWWSEHDPEAFEAQRVEVPLGYIGDCERDIGRAAVFLAGPDSRYVTGTTLVVDGGQQYLR